jgi:hypothetical protein
MADNWHFPKWWFGQAGYTRRFPERRLELLGCDKDDDSVGLHSSKCGGRMSPAARIHREGDWLQPPRAGVALPGARFQLEPATCRRALPAWRAGPSTTHRSEPDEPGTGTDQNQSQILGSFLAPSVLLSARSDPHDPLERRSIRLKHPDRERVAEWRLCTLCMLE